MRSIQTTLAFPLASVKPFEALQPYRDYCITATKRALAGATRRRRRCVACGVDLEPFEDVEGLEYARCPSCKSWFLASIAPPVDWTELLARVTCYRHSPRTFHAGIAQSRHDNVFAPKLDWIHDTLRMQDVSQPRVMEVMTPPSDFQELLRNSGLFAEVLTVDEMRLVRSQSAEGVAPSEPAYKGGSDARAQAAVLLESLDRVDDPAALLRGVWSCLADGGLLFVTALVCSGFDVAVLGLRNLYLYPPDRTNCFSRGGLERLLMAADFTLLEVSTPGVLDVEIVQAHLRHSPSLPLSQFERQLLVADASTQTEFQSFLQQHGMSSFARIVARKRE